MEYLDIEIYDHFKQPHSYIIWNKKKILGQVVEDGIMKILNKEQLVDFYYVGKHKFKIEKHKIEKHLSVDDK
jgi:hypothetical protein